MAAQLEELINTSKPEVRRMAQSQAPTAAAVLGKQINLLYQQSVNSMGLAAVAGVILGTILWGKVSHNHMLLWGAALFLVTAVRLYLVHLFRTHNGISRPKFWGNLYLVGALLTGMIWGAQIFFFDFSWEPRFQFSLMIVMIGVAAGGAWSNSSYFPASVAFVLPVIVPVIWLFIIQSGFYSGMALLVVIYAVLLAHHAYRHQQDLAEALALRYENEQLVAQITASNHELLEKHGIIERDSQLAHRVFAKITQRGGEDIVGISHWEHMAGVFSGDLVLTAERDDGGFIAFLGDFTGHGLPSALGAVPASSIFYSMTRKGLDIIDIAAELNQRLREFLPAEYFCCAVLIEGDLKSGNLRIWNAGLPPVLKITRDGSVKSRIPAGQLPLGIAPYNAQELTYEEIRMRPGDSLYVYSDGLTEAENELGNAFGEQHFEAVLKCPRFGDSRLQNVRSAVLDFLGDLPPQDDVSFLEISMPYKSKLAPDQTELTKDPDVA